jgi:hypothetical protein
MSRRAETPEEPFETARVRRRLDRAAGHGFILSFAGIAGAKKKPCPSDRADVAFRVRAALAYAGTTSTLTAFCWRQCHMAKRLTNVQDSITNNSRFDSRPVNSRCSILPHILPVDYRARR